MRSASIRDIKTELSSKTDKELIDLCLTLARFKKENKELLTYLLYEADNEAYFIEQIKEEVDDMFGEINLSNYYFIKKSIRKILRHIKKHIRYSKKKETEAELLIYFCRKMKEMEPPYEKNIALKNLFARQLNTIKRTLKSLHEDLRHDLEKELEEILRV